MCARRHTTMTPRVACLALWTDDADIRFESVIAIKNRRGRFADPRFGHTLPKGGAGSQAWQRCEQPTSRRSLSFTQTTCTSFIQKCTAWRPGTGISRYISWVAVNVNQKRWKQIIHTRAKSYITRWTRYARKLCNFSHESTT